MQKLIVQVLALLHLPKEGVGRQFLRVAVATISTMVSLQRLLANKYIVKPLIWPLSQLCGEDEVMTDGDFGNSLQICVEDLHKICAVVEPSSPFKSTLLPYLPVLFEVWRVLHSAGAPSSSHTRRVLVRLLKTLDSVTLLAFLKFIACMLAEQEGEVGFKPVCPGIALQCKGDSLTLEHLTEEDRLESYDTGRMESVANCIVTLVESDLNSDQIPGLFFTECLQHIAVVLCRSAGHNASGTSLSSKIEGAQLGQKHQTHGGSDSTLLELEQVLQVPTHTEAYSHALVLYLTAALCERMSDEVLQQSQLQHLIEVISVIVNCHARFVSEPSQKSDKLLVAEEPNLEKLLGGSIMLSIVFGLLSAILGGAREVERKDRPLLSGMLPALEKIASKYPDQELCSISNDLKVCIATLGAVWTAEIKEKAAAVGGSLARRAKAAATESVSESKSGGNRTKVSHPVKQPEPNKVSENDTNPQQSKEYHLVNVSPPSSDLESDGPLCHALRDLKDPLVPVQGHGLITLTKLIENRDPETMSNFSMLLTIFRENLMHSDSYIYLAAINGLVALASAMPREVIPTLCQEYALLQGPPSNRNPTNFDKETGQLRTRPAEVVEGRKQLNSRTSELRMKLGEALVKVVRDCEDTLPQFSDAILGAILSNVCDSDPMIRASSLSNLADVCSLLRFSFSQIQNEVLSCIAHILQVDKEPKVRQAALVVLKLLIKGLSQDSIEVLGGSLLEVYRLLKQVEGGEKDELTRAHAQAALGELDTIMRGFLFPQQTLTKKISVLDQL